MMKMAASIAGEIQQTSPNSHCNAAEPVAAATPSMQQYFTVKAQYSGYLLFYRMGDFYELFFDDAVAAASILDIALTRRGRHAGEEIPMCGVPVHAAESYLEKLIASGRNVAICEQMETPEEAKKRGSKSVVRREVVRLVTPGTITEETLIESTQAHYLACLAMEQKSDSVALAWLDLTTGEFTATAGNSASLPALLSRVAPRELLMSESTQALLNTQAGLLEWRSRATVRPDILFDTRKSARQLADYFGLAASRDLSDLFSGPEITACGVLIEYVQLTQMGAVARLDFPRRQSESGLMQMDAATRRNLELTLTLSGTRHGSLLATIDRTVTSAGARLLHQYVSAPLCACDAIAARADAVEYALNQPAFRNTCRSHLKQIADMERAVGRLSLGRGGPKDLQLLARGLSQANALNDQLRSYALPALLADAIAQLTGHHRLAERLTAALQDSVPMLARDGNFVAAGYRADLDEWRSLRDESRRILAVMEQQLKSDTGITSLKIKHNNVLGYFIEITSIHEKKVPPDFIHRQGLAGSLRYTTPALNATAQKITEAGEKVLQLELLVYQELVGEVLAQVEKIIQAARALAQIDVVTALAERAEEGAWVRPQMVNEAVLRVTAGRHPVVEAALRVQHQEFIANDCELSVASGEWQVASENTRHPSPATRHPFIYLITGPNMGGKSTFLRQQAVLAVLSHIGSFVPAKSATIGLVDRLFCRVGAADDLARGQSTFMVEMTETATILTQATAQSLVVLDEIGRGTATYDGVSIAWAVVEHVHTAIGCRALFATHYHELTALAQSLPMLKNYHASAKEFAGSLVFLHTIAPGFADKSYGIQVAALAGLPKPVLARARALLKILESGHSLTEEETLAALPLFAQTAQHPLPVQEGVGTLEQRLRELSMDDLSPKAAWEILSEWQREVGLS